MGTKRDYKGPEAAFDAYDAAISQVEGLDRKGAANPYTSLNGHMTSFLDKQGHVAVRLPKDAREAFMAEHGTELSMQYGSVMKEFPVVPDELRDDAGALAELLRQSRAWIATLPPKPTKKG